MIDNSLLANLCPTCNATGDIKTNKKLCNWSASKCPVCNGVGYILTPSGDALIAFVLRHVDIPRGFIFKR